MWNISLLRNNEFISEPALCLIRGPQNLSHMRYTIGDHYLKEEEYWQAVRHFARFEQALKR